MLDELERLRGVDYARVCLDVCSVGAQLDVAQLRCHANYMDQLKVVEEHVRLENTHDLDGIMGTFGGEARYDDEPWRERHVGRDAVRAYYQSMLSAAPDLHIAIQQAHAAADAVILEVVISGTHLGTWRGLPPTGHRLEFPLCGIFSFGADGKLAGERIYYDRATVMRQLGLFHEPATIAGRVLTPLSHPVTMARALWRLASGQHRA